MQVFAKRLIFDEHPHRKTAWQRCNGKAISPIYVKASFMNEFRTSC